MTKRRNFVAPRSIDSFDQVQRGFQQLQETLDRVLRSGYVTGVQTHDFSPLSGSFTRVSPQVAGLKTVLPKADPDNAGESIVFSIENPQGKLFVFAAPGDTVNGLTVNEFTVGGIVELFSNGVDAWKSTSQIPGGIGPAGTPGAPGLNGQASPPGLGASAAYALVAARQGVPGRQGVDGTIGRDGVMGPPGRPGQDGRAPMVIQQNNITTTIGTSAVATAVVTLAPSPGTLSGTFTITSSGLTALQQIPVWLAVDSTDPTEAEEQIIFSGVASSATNINVYWQSVDGTPKIGNRTVAFIPTSGALLSVVGSGNAITVSSVVDLTGSTSTLNLTPTGGDLNVYDISTVQCGGSVTFQSLTATNIDGFTAKNDGFFFFLNIRDATTSDYLTLTENNGNAVTSIRTPAARGHRMTKNDSVMLYYSNSRWRVCETVPKLWMVSADNVTFAATQNNYARGDRGSAYMRVTLTGSQSVTGVVPDGDAEGFPGGEIMAIQNIDGTDEIILPHADTGSSATNRWSMPIGLDRTVPPGECAMFRHDGTSDRWRMIASSVDARVLQRIIRITTGAFGATIDPAVTWIRLVGQAGGGGGGGAQAALLREAAAGAGGAGGGYYDIWIPAVAGGGAVSGSVGNGGNGGTTGGSAGSPGGDTTLTYNGVTYTAFGGGAGLGVTSGNGANSAGQLVNMSLGGQGGDSDQTNFEILSGYGGWGMMYAGAAMVNMLAKGGDGGSTFWGNGGLGGLVVGIESIAAGSAGGAYGTGGGGGAKIKNAAGATAGQGGNNGAVGIAIIEMYAGPVPTTGIS